MGARHSEQTEGAPVYPVETPSVKDPGPSAVKHNIPGPKGPLGRSAAPARMPGAPSSSAADVPALAPWKVKIGWISVDPRTGDVSVYPRDVAQRIEDSFIKGDRNVSLIGYGGYYHNATIDFKGTSTGRPLQRMKHGGKRDVRRVEVPPGSTRISIHVIKERSWGIADSPIEGTEERLVPLTAYELLTDRSGGSAAANSDLLSAAQARRAAINAGDQQGQVGLWEWCKGVEKPDKHLIDIPPEMWGVYTAAQNAEIESAFRAGRPSQKVCVGIRDFEIIFDGPDCARQMDHKMKKKRIVRRRLVSAEERDSALNTASSTLPSNNNGDSGEECSICFSSFADTPTMPAVSLSCGHIFHCACAQHLADRNSQCPLCRSDVDWHQALHIRAAGA